MGYRRKSERELGWKRWKGINAELILASGIETGAFENEDSWWEYLEHSWYHPASARWLDREAAQRLVLSWPGGPNTQFGHSLGLLTVRDMMPPELQAAYHEAGHAIVCLLHEIEITGVRLAGLETTFAATPDADIEGSRDPEQRARQWADAAVAGACAENLYNPAQDIQEAISGEDNAIIQVARVFLNKASDQVRREAIERAQMIVADRRIQVQRVAQTLVADRELDVETVKRIATDG